MNINSHSPEAPVGTTLSLDLENIPVEGALGLLAYGDVALTAWREKRVQVEGADWRIKLAKELAPPVLPLTKVA